jgi:hypothetical protein
MWWQQMDWICYSAAQQASSRIFCWQLLVLLCCCCWCRLLAQAQVTFCGCFLLAALLCRFALMVLPEELPHA